MFSSIAESFIQKFCGRYLKNFSSDNISIGVTGTITISNVQLRTEELGNFQLPYRPTKVFIGTLYADLPVVSGGNFDIRISDVLAVVEKNGDSLESLHPFLIQKAVQMWVGAFYFTLANAEFRTSTGVSSGEIEYAQKLLDRLCVTVENVHLRLEEIFTAHIACPIGKETICLGAVLSKAELRPPTSQEIYQDQQAQEAGGKECVWNTNSSRSTLVMNKYFRCDGLSVYCVRDEPLSVVPDEELTAEFCRKHCYHRKVGNVLGPVALTAKFSGAYQRTNLVFGPVALSVDIDGLNFRVNDEQMAYISHILISFETHIHRLQLQSRLRCCREAPESSRRARMRWQLLRDCIRSDWWKFTNNLEEGSIRWRAWFDVWRVAARYVALREILMYHVGFEATPDKIGDSVIYSMSECLLADHHRTPRTWGATVAAANAMATERDDGEGTKMGGIHDAATLEKLLSKKEKRRYQGRGNFSVNVMRAADLLVRNQISSQFQHHTPEEISREQINALSLSPTAVRALYALQLELDALLGVRVAAQCRLWAEEKYRLRRGALQVENRDDEKKDETVGGHSINVYVAVLDAVNLKPQGMGVMSSRKVDAYCSVRATSWEGCGNTDGGFHEVSTESKSAKVSIGTGSAFITWGDTYTLPLVINNEPEDISVHGNGPTTPPRASTPAPPDGNDPAALRIECTSKGIFSPSYGKIVIPRPMLIGADTIPMLVKRGYGATANGSSAPDGGLSAYASASSSAASASSTANLAPFETSINTHVLPLARPTSNTSFFASLGGSSDVPKTPMFSSNASGGITASGSDPDEVTVRIMTMVVAGSASVQQAAYAKFQAKVAETVEERKTMLERQQQTADIEAQRNGAGGDPEDDDDDEGFILDPSVLTVQDMMVSVSIPRISLGIEVLFLTPAQRRAAALAEGMVLPHSVARPVGSYDLRGFTARMVASNNPWIIKANCEIRSFKSRVYNADGSGKLDPKGKTVLSLPEITASLSLTQTSTMSRTISGLLDPTCFDWNGWLKIGPWKVVLNPRSFFSSASSAASPIWKNYRILSHLWQPPMYWAMGSAVTNMGEGGGPPPQSKAEAAMRLGDAYTSFPRRLNVVTELCGALKHPDEGKTGPGEKPSNQIRQTNTLMFITETRTMDLVIDMVMSVDELRQYASGTPKGASSSSIGGKGEQQFVDTEDWVVSDDDEDDDDDDDVPAAAPTAASSAGGTLYDWTFGLAGSIIPIGGSGGNSASASAGAAAQQAKTSAKEKRKAERQKWATEKAQLTAKIAALEKQLAANTKK